MSEKTLNQIEARATSNAQAFTRAHKELWTKNGVPAEATTTSPENFEEHRAPQQELIDNIKTAGANQYKANEAAYNDLALIDAYKDEVPIKVEQPLSVGERVEVQHIELPQPEQK